MLGMVWHGLALLRWNFQVTSRSVPRSLTQQRHFHAKQVMLKVQSSRNQRPPPVCCAGCFFSRYIGSPFKGPNMQRTCGLSRGAGARAQTCSTRTRKLRADFRNNRLIITTIHAAPSNGSSGSIPASTPTIVTDQVVPEGHKGLHGFLYGEGGAERHESSSSYNFRQVR
jgi:hypothetical protein